jgi:isopenicillin N synthase-like dioxygenase
MKHASSDNALRFVKYYKDQEGPIRVGEHCDFGTLTLVHVCDPVEEYEIFYDDKWRTINHPSDDFLIVNIGDFMQIWSDNKLQSTPHRITNKTKKERHSMIMFMDAGNHIIKGIDHAAWNKDRIEKAQSGMTYYHNK